MADETNTGDGGAASTGDGGAPASAPAPAPAGEFADAPWWARPAYIKAVGLALAAAVTAVLAALWQFGVIGGDDGGAPEDVPEAAAPAEPGLPAAGGGDSAEDDGGPAPAEDDDPETSGDGDGGD